MIVKREFVQASDEGRRILAEIRALVGEPGSDL